MTHLFTIFEFSRMNTANHWAAIHIKPELQKSKKNCQFYLQNWTKSKWIKETWIYKRPKCNNTKHLNHFFFIHSSLFAQKFRQKTSVIAYSCIYRVTALRLPCVEAVESCKLDHNDNCI